MTPTQQAMLAIEWGLIARLDRILTFYKEPTKRALRVIRRDPNARHLLNTLFRLNHAHHTPDTQQILDNVCAALCHNTHKGHIMARRHIP